MSLTTLVPSTLDPVNTAHVCAPTEPGGCYDNDCTSVRACLWSWLIVLRLSIDILAAFPFLPPNNRSQMFPLFSHL